MSTNPKRLIVLSGCNGAGKTTAAYALLPDLLNCWEYVNADEIAKGLSPFRIEQVALESGRIMLQRIQTLLSQHSSLAIETTLSTKSYKNLFRDAKNRGYEITLLYFWLNAVNLAKERARSRVSNGGHHIPDEVIERRYIRGIQNLFNIYLPIADEVLIFDNSLNEKKPIAKKLPNGTLKIMDKETYSQILRLMETPTKQTSEKESNYELKDSDIEEMDDFTARIYKGLDIAYERLTQEARKNGTTLVVSKDGEVVHIHP
jgi:predicted ABC-type ATPase